MTVSSVAAFAVASIFDLPQSYWAVLTAVIVTQGSVGGSLKAALDRLLGSLFGAVYGAAVALVLPHSEATLLGAALVAAVLPLSLVAAFNAGFRVAPVTAIIVLLSTTATELGPLGYAAERVAEIGVGSVIGVLISAYLLPAHAHGLVLTTAATIATLLARQLRSLGRVPYEPAPELGEVETKLRKALIRLETLVAEAAHERRSRLSAEADPEPIYRTLRRVRHDVSTLRRIVRSPWPETLESYLAMPWSSVSEAAAQVLERLGRAFALRQSPESSEALSQAIADYGQAIGEIRKQGVTRKMPADAVGRVFGTTFVLEQLQRDLDDLAARAREFARVDAP